MVFPFLPLLLVVEIGQKSINQSILRSDLMATDGSSAAEGGNGNDKDKSLVSRYMNVPVRYLPVVDTPPPPLPPAPEEYPPPSPSRVQLISTLTKEEVEALESERGPYITKPHFRDWTIQELRTHCGKPNTDDDDEIALLNLHRYLVLAQETQGFDIDVNPALSDDVCILPLVCSMESHPESYKMFEDFAQLAIENYNKHSEDHVVFQLEKVHRVNTWSSPPPPGVSDNYLITFHATRDKSTHPEKIPRQLADQDKHTRAIQIFRADVRLQYYDKIEVKSCVPMP